MKYRSTQDSIVSKFELTPLLCGFVLASLANPWALHGQENSTEVLTSPEPRAGTVRVNPIDNQEYAWIPPGTFQMGCVSGDDDCDEDELPRHEVILTKGFWIGRTQVTVEAYLVFSAATEHALPLAPEFNAEWSKKDHPIVRVKWADAAGFCEWARGRLPTEAEWEYSARGGREGLKYPWSNTLSHENANYRGTGWQDAWEYTAPAGSFRKNGYGLRDMAGNVWEWLADWYSPNYYSLSPRSDPAGAPSGQERVLAGGSFFNPYRVLRVSDRFKLVPHSYSYDIGFRCVSHELLEPESEPRP
jgi:sulfatase modifying factor 1